MALNQQTEHALRIALANDTAFANFRSVFGDDGNFRIGEDNDIAIRLRTATLNAATALSNVLEGTPVSAATPANSLLVSNRTADGDIAFFTVNAAGSNSVEALRVDASAGLVVFNEAAGDLDFRVEGDNNANLLTIDAGADNIALGSTVLGGTFLDIEGGAQSRTHVTAQGYCINIEADTYTDGANGSLAISPCVAIGTPTVSTTGTLTDAASLYIAAAPAVTGGGAITRAYSVWADAGRARFDGGISSGNALNNDVRTVTDLDAQSGTWTATQMATGILVHTSVTGAGTVTTDTATNIVAQLDLRNDNECAMIWYVNDGSQTVTLEGGTGVTLADAGSTVLINEGALLLVRRTSATAVTIYHISG